jgi:hypothetical protein
LAKSPSGALLTLDETSRRTEMRISEVAPPRVLIVDDNPDFRFLVAVRIKKKFSIDAEQVGSIAEAELAAHNRQFDIIFFGHPVWEAGVQLYADLLIERKLPGQFIFFMDDPSELAPYLELQLTVVCKPDFDKLIASANWSGSPCRQR